MNTDLRLERVPITHPDAQMLIEAVQAEYVVRYGTQDQSPVDASDFEDPLGRFFVGYLDGAPVATGAWRRSSVTAGIATVVLDIDSSLHQVHSENKAETAPNYKGGFGFHPIYCFADATGEHQYRLRQHLAPVMHRQPLTARRDRRRQRSAEPEPVGKYPKSVQSDMGHDPVTARFHHHVLRAVTVHLASALPGLRPLMCRNTKKSRSGGHSRGWTTLSPSTLVKDRG